MEAPAQLPVLEIQRAILAYGCRYGISSTTKLAAACGLAKTTLENAGKEGHRSHRATKNKMWSYIRNSNGARRIQVAWQQHQQRGAIREFQQRVAANLLQRRWRARRMAQTMACVTIQASTRGWLARRHFKAWRRSSVTIRVYTRQWLARRLVRALHEQRGRYVRVLAEMANPKMDRTLCNCEEMEQRCTMITKKLAALAESSPALKRLLTCLDGGSVPVLTYNIRDKFNEEDFSKFLRATQAAIICIQEVGKQGWEYIEKAAKDQGYGVAFRPTKGHATKAEHIGFVYRRSVVELAQDSKENEYCALLHAQYDGKVQVFKRQPLLGLFRVVDTNFFLPVVTFHLDYKDRHAANEPRHLFNAIRALGLSLETNEDQDSVCTQMAVIVAGDANLSTMHKAWKKGFMNKTFKVTGGDKEAPWVNVVPQGGTMVNRNGASNDIVLVPRTTYQNLNMQQVYPKEMPVSLKSDHYSVGVKFSKADCLFAGQRTEKTPVHVDELMKTLDKFRAKCQLGSGAKSVQEVFNVTLKSY